MKNLFTLAMLFSVFITFAQDSIPASEEAPKKKLSFSGSVDAYYRTNLGAPNGGENSQTPNTSFANGNGFAIGMANAIISYEGKKVGAVADLVFGPRGTDAVFGSLQWDIDGDGAPDLGNSSQVVNRSTEHCPLTTNHRDLLHLGFRRLLQKHP